MSNLDFDKEEKVMKWLEERMKQESENVPIPESLEPQRIEEKLKEIEQRKPKKNWKKTAVIAASFILVAGVSLQVGRVTKEGTTSDNSIMMEDYADVATEGTEETAVDEPSEDINYSAAEDKEASRGENESVSQQLEDIANQTEDSMKATSEELNSIEVKMFTEGDGKSAVTDGKIIYSGEEREIVVSEYASGKVKELARITVNQSAKDFYLAGKTLICISTEENGTTIYTLDVTKKKEPKLLSTISVGGGYQCSYLEGKELFVFTKAGNLQRLNLANGQTNTFSVQEDDASYYMAGGIVYTLKAGEQGTSIVKYQISNSSFERKETVTCDALLEQIIGMEEKDNGLMLLIAQEDGVTLQGYDDKMRSIITKKNSLGERVFAGVFSAEGIIVMSHSNSKVTLTMLDTQSLEQKQVTVLEGITQVRMNQLMLDSSKSWIGFETKNTESDGYRYVIYSYGESGFLEVKSTELDENENLTCFLAGDSVLTASKEGLKVLLE